MLVLAALGAAGLWWYTDAQVERESIGAVEDQGDETSETRDDDDPVEFLVVGTDDRSGLSREEQLELSTGRPVGSVRSDVMLLVQVRPAEDSAAMVSIPRDLLVDHRGTEVKLNSVLARSGRDGLVTAVEELSGIQVDHYVEISIPGFLTVVEAVGGVELCLDEPLVDPKSGADLPAGCQDLDAEEALSFVRSRQSARGDFRRIERQQEFLDALLDEVTSTRTALDVPRLFRIADRAAGSLTTDAELSLRDLRGLAEDLRGLAAGDVAAATVPAYSVDDALVAYGPGAEELFAAFRDGDPLPDLGDPAERSGTRVQLWHDRAPQRAAQIESTLFFLGFEPEPVERGPVRPLGVEVFAREIDDEAAKWVANALGTEVRSLPEDAEFEGVDVLVGIAGGA